VVACLTAIVSCSRRQQRGNAALDLVAEDTPKLGCVWDGTGCAEGCDAEAMEARCQRLSHDQEECETGAGQTERCTWSHGSNKHFGAILKGEDESMELLSDSKMMRGGGSSSNKMKGSRSSSSSSSGRSGSSKSKSKSMDHGSSSKDKDGHGAANELDSEGKGYDASKSGKSSSGGKSSKKGSGSSSRGSKSSGYKKSGSGSSSSDKPKLGCVWDGTGCHDDDCDTMAMEDRCQKLSHDQGECEGDVGSYNRCVWSHGSQSKSRLNVLKAHKSNMKMMSRSSGQNNKQQNAKEKQMEEEIAPRLGCIWDLTGCAAGCDEQVMDQRCDRMSHDQEMCEGEIGVFNRCVWSHGSDSHMNVDIHFSDIGEDSTVDILLIVAGVVTAMFIIQQFYKWWRNREYKKVQETQHHEEIQITSHSV